jgi:Fibronectin type III domain
MNGCRALIFGITLAFLGGTAAMAQTVRPIPFPDQDKQDQSSDDKAAPAAPTNLQAEAVSSTSVALIWQDNSNNESEFLVEARTASQTTFTQLTPTVAPNRPAVFVDNLTPGTTYFFRVRANNGTGPSAYSNVVSVTTPASDGPCAQTSTAMCLNNDRFRVQAMFFTPQGQNGQGQTVKLTTDSGYLWFFSATNIEAIVKVLNACTTATGNHYWVFAGGLTNVRVLLTVTDTGVSPNASKGYVNPQGVAFQPIQDTIAFATCP